METNQSPFARGLAIASCLAAIVPFVGEYLGPSVKKVLGHASMTMVPAGFAMAVVALFIAMTRKTRGVILLAIIGFVLNGILIGGYYLAKWSDPHAPETPTNNRPAASAHS